jgi:signal-transduction protein with cAMP-binding, CBS, and nucleotidyltransferase domain
MIDASLPTRNLPESVSLEFLRRSPPAVVQLDSPAQAVMIDINELSGATVMPHEDLGQAEQRMAQQGAQVLLVVAQVPRVLGILALADLHGEKPLQVASERRLTHPEMRVVDLMQPVSQLDATLLRSGRTHLLVVEPGGNDGTLRLRGVVSRSQVERQLGTRLPSTTIADTFAAIEQALI